MGLIVLNDGQVLRPDNGEVLDACLQNATAAVAGTVVVSGDLSAIEDVLLARIDALRTHVDELVEENHELRSQLVQKGQVCRALRQELQRVKLMAMQKGTYD